MRDRRGFVINGTLPAQSQCRTVRLSDDKSLGIIIAGPGIPFGEMTTGTPPMRYIYKESTKIFSHDRG
jgi:hypothetical protein